MATKRRHFLIRFVVESRTAEVLDLSRVLAIEFASGKQASCGLMTVRKHRSLVGAILCSRPAKLLPRRRGRRRRILVTVDIGTSSQASVFDRVTMAQFASTFRPSFAAAEKTRRGGRIVRTWKPKLVG